HQPRLLIVYARRHSAARSEAERTRNPYSRSWLWISDLCQEAHPGMRLLGATSRSIARRTSLHHRLDLGAEGLPRSVTRIEHVSAGIDHEFHPRWRSKRRELIELDLRAEIRRGEVEQPVPDQQLQPGIECENFPQLRDRLRRVDATTEVPGLLDRVVEQMVGAVRPPIQLACEQIDRGAGQRRGQ